MANDWLRFWEGTKPGKHVVRDESSVPDYELMRVIAMLSEGHQAVVRELVAALRRAEKR